MTNFRALLLAAVLGGVVGSAFTIGVAYYVVLRPYMEQIEKLSAKADALAEKLDEMKAVHTRFKDQVAEAMDATARMKKSAESSETYKTIAETLRQLGDRVTGEERTDEPSDGPPNPPDD